MIGNDAVVSIGFSGFGSLGAEEGWDAEGPSPSALRSEVLTMYLRLRFAGQHLVLPRARRVTVQRKESFAGIFESVTEADLLSSSFLLNSVTASFPGSFTEEQLSAERTLHDLIWEIDPLDGTDEFCAGMTEGYCIQGALLARQSDGQYRPAAGVLYQPGRDLGYIAIQGDAPLLMSGLKPLPLPAPVRDRIRGTIRTVDPSGRLVSYYRSLGDRLGIPVEIIYGGSSGSCLLQLLTGQANVVVMNYNYSKEWDTAPAEPMIASLGGFMTDLAGMPLRYNQEDFLLRRGYAASIAFTASEILPGDPDLLLEDRLQTSSTAAAA